MSQSTDRLQETFDRAMNHHRAGRLEEAGTLYRHILAQHPNHADALRMLGVLASQYGESGAAAELLRRAIHINPDVAEYHADLGAVLRASGRPHDAVEAYRRFVQHQPASSEALLTLGNVLLEAWRVVEAIEVYRQALALNPDYAEAHNNLGNALSRLGKVDEAAEAYRNAIAARPDLAEAHCNLANTLKDSGQLDEALICYQRAEDLKPDARIAGARLYALQLHPDCDPKQILLEHRRWNEKYARPLAASIRPHENDRSPKRISATSVQPRLRLRIGYVSGDFNDHPVGRFLLPILANHDKKQFEIFGYSDTRKQNALTEQIRLLMDQWRVTMAQSDEQLAELVRRDRIDVLVDLTMHAHGSRLLAFARKPAPVQVTYLAYCGTTGLETMDYRLTDPYLDPPGTDDLYSEKSIRLANCYWCYAPPPEAMRDPGPLPAGSRGHVTFGCLNNFAKVTKDALLTWSELLQRVDGSRLVLQSGQGAHRQRVTESLASQGIGPQRIEFIERIPLAEYFAQYQRIDIALDPFPFPGGTTSCDALWMGVPVVSLAGSTAMSRAGLSILSNIGMPELVAQTRDQYVSIASSLAADLPRLAGMRARLRRQMAGSPLTDACLFTADLERIYRQIWRTWAASSD